MKVKQQEEQQKQQELKKQQEQEIQNKQKEATPQQKTNQASEQNGSCNICHFTYKLATVGSISWPENTCFRR
ncbi:hypothetical protein [Bacillus sp. NH11B]|uniref:hypothetical protein n=1 Tax=Bacillus sp. NH11B TaxID=1866314 RepID=UPI0008FE36A2|nr:hypothetical protein [Bacillus sp. NH11B]